MKWRHTGWSQKSHHSWFLSTQYSFTVLQCTKWTIVPKMTKINTCPFRSKWTLVQNIKHSWLSKHKICPYSVFGGFLRIYLSFCLHLQSVISITWQPLASKWAFLSIHFRCFSSCLFVGFLMHWHPWYLQPLYSHTVSTPLITAYPSTWNPKKCSTVHFVQKCTTVQKLTVD